jgi:hypothetical protein
MIRPLALLALLTGLVLNLAPATALDVDGMTLFTGNDKLPSLVQEQVTCQTEDDPQGTRRPFAGGFVFTARCPGNHANSVQALVFAAGEDGVGAQLIRFARPTGAAAEELSNVRWDPARWEVGELSVNPEERICRTEGRWRLTGAKAQLMFWRETRDCDGKRGWRTVVDQRKR